MQENINKIRVEIDKIDNQIRDLINQRAKLAIEIGKIKHAMKLKTHVPEREAEVLNRLTSENPGPLKTEHLKAIFDAIMAACLDLQKKLD